MTTIGIIYPDHAAEDEYPTAASLLGVRLPVVHIYGTDLHAVPELLDLGSPEKLAEGVSRLIAAVAADAVGPVDASAGAVDAVMWACTSGSFVYGHAGVRQQADQLATVAGVPAASTSQSFVAAVAALGVGRVAVAASYPEEVAVLFTDFLAASGIEVVARGSAAIDTAAEVGSLEGARVMDLALQNDHPAAEALLIPDTAMHTLDVLPAIEGRLGKPVLTANQVTIWHGLRLAGSPVVSDRLGALFTRV
ncbi:arylmalonate decarboxylase [Citricoccus zhacaiensis]|uniref:Arylmalonate decarboxylase n=1 Tax=Citricoccus zhacaiensis TaxID=489142 RepID=A0ABQ2LM52_9MICC|nr:maleate cis-trans isomerase [Citricoccus zhacaiensis]GGO39977.1 arylmalonate decarboxylase [Citricoccus zhacaiensis]